MNKQIIKNRIGVIRIKKNVFLAFLMIYSLFALNRIKYAISFKVNGNATNNMIFVITFVSIALAIITKTKVRARLSIGHITTIYLLLSVFVAQLNGASFMSSLYAFAQLLIPFLGFLLASKLRKDEIQAFIKFIIIASGLYALLTLFVSLNYNYFASIFGVPEITTYSRFARVNMPIGSSITVSYFLNITSLICAIGVQKYKINKKMKYVSIVSLVLSMICIALLNSRAAIIVLIIDSFAFFKYTIKVNRKGLSVLLYFAIAAIVVFYYLKYGEIDRFINRTSTIAMSDLSRYQEAIKGFKIFMDHPFFGTGIGAVYNRAGSRNQMYNGMSIISDPHNAYVMLLSETGLFGLVLEALFCVNLIKEAKKNDSTRHGIFVRKTLIISILIQSLFGAHIINEPNYSVIFWILLGLSVAINKNNEEMNW